MTTSRAVPVLCLALFTLGGCKKPAPTTPTLTPTPTPVVAPSVAVDAGIADSAATVSPSVATGPAASPPIGAPLGEDLVRRLGLTVRASSTTGGATTADKMLDNNLQTAWNSRTGDLVGAWFEVDVPPGVTVASFAMTAGFTSQSGRNDLFASNHRVERVSVSRDGAALGEFALDPESRAMQVFGLSGDAGTYRFTITAERAGTRPSWRELCVSEFVLYGSAPEGMAGPDAADTDASAPNTDGGEDGAAAAATVSDASAAQAPENEQPEPLTPSAPAALTAEATVQSVEQFCTAMQRRRFQRARCAQAATERGQPACFCGQMPGPNAPEQFTARNRQASLQRPATPFLGAYFMARAANPTDVVRCDLLVRTPTGLFPFVEVADCAPGGGGGSYPSLEVRRMRATGGDAGAASLEVEWRETHARPTATRNWACVGSWLARCTVDAAGTPSCTKEQQGDETCTEETSDGSPVTNDQTE